MARAAGGGRIRTPERDDMAVRADRRFPQRPGGTNGGGRDRRNNVALLVVDDDVAAGLDQDRAAVTADGG